MSGQHSIYRSSAAQLLVGGPISVAYLGRERGTKTPPEGYEGLHRVTYESAADPINQIMWLFRMCADPFGAASSYLSARMLRPDPFNPFAPDPVLPEDDPFEVCAACEKIAQHPFWTGE